MRRALTPPAPKRHRIGEVSHDGDDLTRDRDGDLSDTGEVESDGSSTARFQLSEEGEAFLEATFNSRLKYTDRKKQIAKYGEPDSKWTTCPSISPVVAATLPGSALAEDEVAFRMQQMYMEVTAPLVALLENTGDESFSMKEASPMVQSAIRLLGDAAQHHSSLRRKAIMKHLNPQLQTLMKDEDFKGSQPFLFGEDFGDKAKGRMEAAAALRKVINPSGPKGKQTVFQKDHPQRGNSWGRQGVKPKYYSPANKPKKDSGPKGKPRLVTPTILSTPHVSNLSTIVNHTPMLTQVASPKHHLEVLIGQMNLTITSPILAGRLAQFIPNWQKVTQDRWVLQAIGGYQLELVQTPWQIKPMPAINCAIGDKELISKEVKELLSKGAVVEIPPSQEGFVSQLFLVEKKEGGQRPVVNLKALNMFVKHEHFKMEGLHTLPDLIQPEDWMIKLDLKDAYLQVPIHVEQQHLLQFRWELKTYQFQCLPFGLTSAPRVFSKIMKPVVGVLRQMSVRLVIYLDDILILHQSEKELVQLTPLICQLFGALGLVVNQKKSILTPTQNLEFLGFQVDAVRLQLIFPTEKLRKIQQLAQHLLHQQTVSVRDIARFVGKASASTRAVWQAPLHFRALQFAMNSVTLENHHTEAEQLARKFSTNLVLNRQAKDDLQWWAALDRKVSLQSPLLPRVPTMIIESDASNVGWGARQGELQTGGRWSLEETSHHINYLELLAAFLALQSFTKQRKGITVQMKLDNVTAVTYINKLGGTHSQVLCQLALTIWDWCIQRDVFLVAEHLPGKDNITADRESRTMKDRCDWMLNPQVFQQIQLQMGPLQIDLFASRLTKQLPSFYSWRPDPEAMATDAFSQDWARTRGFANPPWCLIAHCLSQVKRQVARVVIITPLWTSQPWHPTILGMIEDYPRVLPAKEDLVLLQAGQEFIMNQGVPVLVAWPISGNPSHHEDFLQRLQRSSLHHGDPKHSRTTTPCFQNGLVGVCRGIEIPLWDL